MSKSDITTIRVQRDLKEKIEVIQKNYQYNFIYEVLDDMTSFFLNNGLSPATNLNLNIHKDIQKINEDFKKRDDSFRKWFGDHFKKTIELIQQSDMILANQELFKNILQGEIKEEIKKEIISEDNFKKPNEVIAVTQNFEKTNSSNIDDYLNVIEKLNKQISDLKSSVNLIVSKAEKNEKGKVHYTIVLNEIEYNSLKRI
ncbi:hypothetical protein [Myroides sp. NP-2]|uniref:hypothetical protein n=1 Tax=unclassified Myroides TaxID=2642485 RepID=UPI0015FC732F|nr:hypothetical protein [Myroides sp. NP-2]MBB1151329.1 hypothetical protein [Myroides sp. NP-2]